MKKASAGLPQSKPKIYLRYIRLPNHIKEFWDELVFRSDKVIVGKSQVTSENTVTFDGKTVLASGFQIVYFEFPGKWFSIGKIRNQRGEHTEYYCDIIMPPRLLKDGVELTDLFLDLWVSPDLRYKILDEEEFEEAFRKGWMTKRLYEKAKRESQKLIRMVESKKFPPPPVKDLEKKLRL